MKSVYHWLLVPLGLFLASCAGQLEGTACLDGNGNNVCDDGEHTLTNIGLKVTKDGQLLAQPRTNSLGRFFHAIETAGYYCVEVDEPHLSQSLMFQLTYGQISGQAVQPAASNISLGPPLSLSAKQILSPAGNGTTNAPTPTQTTTIQEDEEGETSPPPLPATPDSVAPGKVCKNLTGLSQTLHVPVQIDYQADADRMPPRIRQEKGVGEIFTLPVPVSVGCVMETLYLPDGLVPLWPSSVEEINKILNIDREAGRIDFRPQARATSVVLSLKVREDLPLGSYEVQIEPAMLCPAGRRIALHPIPLHLVIRPLLELSQNLSSAVQRPGGALTWTIVAENEGRQTLSLDMIGTTSGPVAAVTPQSGLCHASGSNRIECALDLDAGQVIEVDVSVRILNAEEEGVITFDADARVEGYDESFTASPAEIRVASD